MVYLKHMILLAGLTAASVCVALPSEDNSIPASEKKADNRPSVAPDIRDDESKLKIQRGDFVIVPIPISNPTLDTGIVVGAAYFYAQSAEQKKTQPASLTAAGAMYTSNDSRAFALVQQNYWRRNTWRFTGAAGAADLRLSLLTPDETSSGQSVGWRINGEFVFGKISRRLTGQWYGGFNMRFVNADQSLETALPESNSNFDTTADARTSGLGTSIEFDSRDMPLNTYDRQYFNASALFNDEALGSNKTYQSYSLAYRSYHDISESLVLAWEVQGCKRGGTAPLWDACSIDLRGFPVTDYLGEISASGQVEARWRLNKRWGLVGFAGSGYVGNSFNGIRENEPIPSYGAGVRFTVLAAKRVNLRLDYARSNDSDAIYFSVGEVF
jgi:hypothetical protein